MKAGLAVIEALRAEGVEYTFGVVGATTNSIVTEMYGRTDITFVDTRHEEGAAFMAYGYARASGKPTACITTSGPGTTNLVTGIALAYKGRAPVIVLAGDVARDYIYRLAEAYGARGAHVQHPDEIGDAVKQALAANGPTVIEIPVAEYFPPAAPTPGSAGGARH